MNRRRLSNLWFVVFLMGIPACSSFPSPTPPLVIDSAATEIAVETAVAASLTATAPTDTPTPTFTWTPGTPTSVPTRPATPTAIPTPIPPPGVYIVALELSPSSPYYHQEVVFRATFLNTGEQRELKWFVSIWLSAQSNRFGQTSWDRVFTIPHGTSTFETYSPNWKLTGPDYRYPPCVPFTAKVQWKEPPPDNSEPVFTMPDGQDFQLPFEVCPPP